MTSRLRGHVASSTSSIPLSTLASSPWLDEFYERRDYRPAWLGPNGLLSQAFELVGCLREAGRDGLYPSDYGVQALEVSVVVDFDPLGDRKSAAQLELKLTNAFLEFSDHLLRGRLESRRVNSEWQVGSVAADLAGVLQTALDLHQVRETLDSLRPRQRGYVQLQETLLLYERIATAGGWGEIPPAEMTKTHIAAQVRRLRLSGDLPLGAELAKGGALAAGIGRFQTRHGLEVTGFVNEKTRAVMNVSASRRADQVRANLERWRWLPHEMGSRSIVVRIADFRIDLVEDGQVVESMRAVVGRPYRRTPLFSSYMTHVVFQPTWNIPRRIASEEILPILRRDAGYLESRRISVLNSRGQVQSDPIDWGAVGSEAFSYQLVQAPGPFNPLGRVKFTFPNSFQIAIHDTPQKDLFSERVRDFSHGCIRAEDSEALAAFILRDDPSWNRSRVATALDASQTRSVRLREPMPVYVLYWTVWVDDGGEVQFRADLYDIDQQLIEALSEARQYPGSS